MHGLNIKIMQLRLMRYKKKMGYVYSRMTLNIAKVSKNTLAPQKRSYDKSR